MRNCLPESCGWILRRILRLIPVLIPQGGSKEISRHWPARLHTSWPCDPVAMLPPCWLPLPRIRRCHRNVAPMRWLAWLNSPSSTATRCQLQPTIQIQSWPARLVGSLPRKEARRTLQRLARTSRIGLALSTQRPGSLVSGLTAMPKPVGASFLARPEGNAPPATCWMDAVRTSDRISPASSRGWDVGGYSNRCSSPAERSARAIRRMPCTLWTDACSTACH